MVRERAEALLAGYARGRLLREGAATVIVGRPNVGKSSLLNALLGEARAIVTEVPGTTRDIIEEGIDLAGVPLRLVDTAGIRRTEDVVERIGVERSRASLAEADLVLLVLDASEPLTPEDMDLLAEVADRPSIRVRNKADLPAAWDAAALPGEAPTVALSATTGLGLPNIEAAIAARLLGGLPHEDATLATARQADAARRAVEAIAQAQETLAEGGTEDLLAVDLMAAAEALGEITGETARAEVIEELFRRFCVGK
jgi:tRNA modification GTPase